MNLRGHYEHLRQDGATIEELAMQARVPVGELERVLSGKEPESFLEPDMVERILAITPETRQLLRNSRISRRDADEAVLALMETGYNLHTIERVTGVSGKVVMPTSTETTTIENRASAQILDMAETHAYQPRPILFHDKRFSAEVVNSRKPSAQSVRKAKDIFEQRWGVPFNRHAIETKLGIGVAQ